MMNINLLITRCRSLSLQSLKNIPKRYYAAADSKYLKEIEVDEVPVYDSDEEIIAEKDITEIINKSRLNPEHRRILYNKKPYDESHIRAHDTVKYRKKIMGTYGIEAAGVSPAIAWPTKEEIEDMKEIERVACPKTLHEMWKDIEERKAAEAEAIKQREQDIDKVIANFDKWQDALNAKIAKKEAEVLEARRRREILIEEVREQFGYNIDTRDPRFKEALEARELQDKKTKKNAKKKARSEKLMNYIIKAAEKSSTEDMSKLDANSNEQKNETADKKAEE